MRHAEPPRAAGAAGNERGREGAPPLRLGAIEFYNSLPVYQGIYSGAVTLPRGTEIVKGIPSEMNRGVLAGTLDIAPVSSIEYARHASELVALPGLSINSHGFANSVNLVSALPLAALDGKRIRITSASASSDLLLRILLEERFGVKAELTKGIARLDAIGRDYEACLLIGDESMHALRTHPRLLRFDLGAQWRDHTGHPMVFAIWVAHREIAETRGSDVEAVRAALLESRAWGLKNKDAVVFEAQRASGFSAVELEAYFRDLNYDLDGDKIQGLRAFYEAALLRGEIPEMPRLPKPEAPRWK
ncbi:MAG: menaquinone biosynthesis protein [Euryarchaeota archaeon]|nr:menaquinone biosynthesis protein [Euryarchaeota archaeon]